LMLVIKCPDRTAANQRVAQLVELAVADLMRLYPDQPKLADLPDLDGQFGADAQAVERPRKELAHGLGGREAIAPSAAQPRGDQCSPEHEPNRQWIENIHEGHGHSPSCGKNGRCRG